MWLACDPGARGHETLTVDAAAGFERRLEPGCAL
jgi:hypothetical protein